MLELNKHVVIFDTEYTAWEGSRERGWSNEGEYKEIVQIGGIIIDTQNLVEIDSFNVFIKPERNPILSDYFINLTAITQDVIDDKGVSLDSAYSRFVEWSKGLDSYSFGHDEKVIIENFKLLNIAKDFSTQNFFNARSLFEDNGIDTKGYNSGNVIELFGKKSILRAHDALNDSRIIVEALREMVSKKP